jgi:hypothetical protein
MRGTKWAVGLTVVLAGAIGLGRARDEDATFDLRGPAPAKGQVYLTKEVSKIKGANLAVSVGGQNLKLKQTMVETVEEEIKLLAVDGRNVTKAQTKVIKKVTDVTTDLNGEANTETQRDDLEGTVIIAERLGEGKWKHTLVDDKPTAKQKKKLDRRVGPENDDDLYPAGKVKVGHEWTVDAAAMKKFLGNDFSDISGKMKQKFVKVEAVDGDDCAVIESTGSIKGKLTDDDDDMLNVELVVSKATTWRSIKTGIDVKSKLEGKLKLAGKKKIEGAEADLVMEGPLVVDSTTRLK